MNFSNSGCTVETQIRYIRHRAGENGSIQCGTGEEGKSESFSDHFDIVGISLAKSKGPARVTLVDGKESQAVLRTVTPRTHAV